MGDEKAHDKEMAPGFESHTRLRINPEGRPHVTSCQCTGPREGEPLCPCRMKARGVTKRDGRWVIPEQDLGST